MPFEQPDRAIGRFRANDGADRQRKGEEADAVHDGDADAVWDSRHGLAANERKKKSRKDVAPATAVDLPDFIAPQLCETLERPPAGKNWLHEIKFDGYRIQMRVAEAHERPDFGSHAQRRLALRVVCDHTVAPGRLCFVKGRVRPLLQRFRGQAVVAFFKDGHPDADGDVWSDGRSRVRE